MLCCTPDPSNRQSPESFSKFDINEQVILKLSLVVFTKKARKLLPELCIYHFEKQTQRQTARKEEKKSLPSKNTVSST